MKIERQHSRIKCGSHCVLMGRDGSNFHASLENISLGGALIKVSDGVPLNVGDLCHLNLCNDSDLCKYSSQIMRIDPDGIGVSFIPYRFNAGTEYRV